MQEKNLFPGMAEYMAKVLDDSKTDSRQFNDIHLANKFA